MDVVERAILFFRDEGQSGERFADTVARLGFDYVQEKLLTDSEIARPGQDRRGRRHLLTPGEKSPRP